MWRDLHVRVYPGIQHMFAIPNGAYLQGDKRRRAMQWAKLKRQGAKEGVSDIFLPVARNGYHGLWIELKSTREYRPRVSDDQRNWISSMNGEGYLAVVSYGFDEAVAVIRDYYSGRR